MTGERDHGVQPIAALLAHHQLAPTDLVRASTEQLTHKMVARALRGRELTSNVMGKVQRALNAAAKSEYTLAQLFSYAQKR